MACKLCNGIILGMRLLCSDDCKMYARSLKTSPQTVIQNMVNVLVERGADGAILHGQRLDLLKRWAWVETTATGAHVLTPHGYKAAKYFGFWVADDALAKKTA